MVNLIKQNKNSLGVTASDKNFDSTLAVTTRQLLYNSDSLKLVVDTVMDDTLFIRVAVFNKTGHKFPSGYPSRRAVLRCLAIKANGDTLFGSGLFDSTMEVQNIDSVFEPHYDVITHPDQIQIYEMVPGDVNGNKTTILERAYAPIKDNRIPPLGFTTTFSTYDTCKIVGAALTDPDFNKIGTTEGSGMDIVHYHIALNGYTGLLKLFTGIYYQLLSPGWLKEMFTHSAAEIDTFKAMYNSADKEPILTGADSVVNLNITTGIWQTPNASLSVGPNPTSDGWIRINLVSSQLKEIELYDLNGKRAAVKMIPNGANNYKLHLPDEPGIWILRIRTQVGEVVRKIIRL
jgi:hypothetical protein